LEAAAQHLIFPEMAIRYPLPPRSLVLCDYSLGGFREPEMVKRRPALVISPRLPHRDGLCSVVPLSTSPPQRSVDYVVRIELDPALPAPFDSPELWAKCDMVACVGFNRLDLFRHPRAGGDKRKYIKPLLDQAQFKAVVEGVCCGLGIKR
jgi:uncharacterized protein YifN (PemK superfamily)